MFLSCIEFGALTENSGQTYERGAMQAVYTRYRDLKKDIRNLAAVDLQRCVRGFLVRSKSDGAIATSTGSRKRKDGASSAKQQPTSFHQQAQLPASTGGAALSAAAQHAAAGDDLYAKYKELLNSKRELKRRLKRFDEDFFEQWGRQPKKVDKEVRSPLWRCPSSP